MSVGHVPARHRDRHAAMCRPRGHVTGTRARDGHAVPWSGVTKRTAGGREGRAVSQVLGADTHLYGLSVHQHLPAGGGARAGP